ncbi:MAG: TRZ/ATZ family hydrolase, partial [Burkholderiales bacterium]
MHILSARWVIPVEPAGVVLEHHAVVIDGTRIAAILPDAVARTQYPGAEVTSLPNHVLIPGLINLHTHAAMTLLRGLADDQPLMTWLEKHIWP